jgi:chitodextrinase
MSRTAKRLVPAALAAALLLAGCSREPAKPSPAPPPTGSAAPPAAPAPEAEPRAARSGDTSPPTVPSRLEAVLQPPSSVALSWAPSSDDVGVTGYEVQREGRRVAMATEPRALEAGLRADARHCYTVRARDAAGNASAWTPPACVDVPDTQAPSVPPALAAAVQPGGKVALSWGASTDDVGIMGYEVWRGKVRATVASSRSFTDVSVPIAVEQCYTVVAFDRAGNRSEPAGPSCVTLPDVTPPSVPTRLSAKAPGETDVLLTWDAASDDVAVVRYEIARTEPAGSQPSVPTTAEVAAHDTGLRVATRYCYAVRACDAAGNCSAPSEPACATTPDLTPPSTPASVTARAASDKAVDLRWPAAVDNVGVAGYEVRRGAQVVAASVREPAFRDTGLRPAVEYCYTVVALDAAGNRAAPSPEGCARTPDLTPPTVPDRPAATPVSASQVFIAWDPSTDDVGVAGYEVRRGSTLVANVQVWRARERGLAAQTEYCYTVVAYDAAGNRSAPTAPLCARTNDPSQLSAPSDLRVRRLTATSLLLQWEPSEESGVLYRVYAQGDKVVGLTRFATYEPSGRMAAQPNCFRVSAVDSQGRESGRSNEVCARPLPGAPGAAPAAGPGGAAPAAPGEAPSAAPGSAAPAAPVDAPSAAPGSSAPAPPGAAPSPTT